MPKQPLPVPPRSFMQASDPENRLFAIERWTESITVILEDMLREDLLDDTEAMRRTIMYGMWS